MRLPEARSPSRLEGMGERRKFPQRGLGLRPRNLRGFEPFKPKWNTFWDPVNLTFLNNSIEKIVSERFLFYKLEAAFTNNDYVAVALNHLIVFFTITY